MWDGNRPIQIGQRQRNWIPTPDNFRLHLGESEDERRRAFAFASFLLNYLSYARIARMSHACPQSAKAKHTHPPLYRYLDLV